MFNKIKELFTPSTLNKWRYAILTNENSRFRLFEPPRYTFFIVTTCTLLYTAPILIASYKQKAEAQERVDERKMREGVFLLQMMEWFEEGENETKKVMTKNETVGHFLQRVQGENLNETTSEDILTASEEEMLDVERWPEGYEQRHSVFYRNRVRRKLEQVERCLNELEASSSSQ